MVGQADQGHTLGLRRGGRDGSAMGRVWSGCSLSVSHRWMKGPSVARGLPLGSVDEGDLGRHNHTRGLVGVQPPRGHEQRGSQQEASLTGPLQSRPGGAPATANHRSMPPCPLPTYERLRAT